MNFKDFKKEKSEDFKKKLYNESDEPLVAENEKLVIESFLNENKSLSDETLISLVMQYQGKEIKESCMNELIMFDYIKDNKVTKEGIDFLNESETHYRLKQLIE